MGSSRRRLVAPIISAIIVLASFPVTAHAAGGGTKPCNPRKGACSGPSSDTTAPSVSISSPGGGATINGTTTVTGTSADAVGVASVEVRVDSGSWVAASGTGAWSSALNTAAYADGAHTISARAADAAGNVATTSVNVSFANAPQAGSLVTERTLTNQVTGAGVVPIGRGRMASRGALSVALYRDQGTLDPWAYFRDASTGSERHLAIPFDSLLGWTEAAAILTADDDLWILSGSGPVYLRRFHLTGSPLPTSMTYVSTQTLGDADSRMGDLIRLASGGLVAAWHQQGGSGPQGHRIAYRTPAGVWSTQTLSFLPTRSSKDELEQHPSDGGVWLFNSPDGWSSIGAVHLTETGEALRLDWTDAYFIDSRAGEFDADPENPDLAVASDPASGEIVLAYQSAHRAILGGVVTGSWPAIARIRADGSKSFVHLPVWVERVTRLGLVVRPGEVWLAYQPIDETAYTFDRLAVSRYRAGAWENQQLGRLSQTYARVNYGTGQPAFLERLSDGAARLWNSS